MAVVALRRWILPAVLVLVVSACTTGSSETGETAGSIPEVTVNDVSTTDTSSMSDGVPPTTQAFDESTTTTSSAPPTTAVTSTTATTATTSTTVPTVPAVTAAAGTPDDPVPLDEFIGLGDWILAVTDVTLDATELLQDAAEFNVPPPTGKQYVVIELTGTYRGDTAGQPVVEWNLILGDVVVPAAGDACGLVPDNLIDVPPVLVGDSFEANICFVAPASLGDEPPLLRLDPVDQGGETHGGFFFSLS